MSDFARTYLLGLATGVVLGPLFIAAGLYLLSLRKPKPVTLRNVSFPRAVPAEEERPLPFGRGAR
jgi:hypothetical protein